MSVELVQQTTDRAAAKIPPGVKRVAMTIAKQREGADEASTYNVLPCISAPVWTKYETEAYELIRVVTDGMQAGEIVAAKYQRRHRR